MLQETILEILKVCECIFITNFNKKIHFKTVKIL